MLKLLYWGIVFLSAPMSAALTPWRHVMLHRENDTSTMHEASLNAPLRMSD